MRYDGSYLRRQIDSNFQTKGNNCDPSAVVKVTRHTIPISYWDFVERSLITTESGITDISVATKHTTYDRGEQEVWVAYVRNGKLKVKSSRVTDDIVGFNWISDPIDYDASSCAIAFNSRVERTAYGKQEFLTDEYPWVFWVENGALRAWQINSNSLPTELAAENVTDVSAVRGPSGQWGNWDLGLSAFFIMNGGLYYRQYIDGEWYDAEQVSSGPSGSYIKLAAYRTWDYRVCLQALMDDGKLYNLFTYTEGIGARGTEHTEFSNISVDVSLKGIEVYNEFTIEHILFSSISVNAIVLYAFSAAPVSIENTSSTTIKVVFDYPVTSGTATTSMFTLVDSNGINYVCNSLSTNNKTLTLTFDAFDLAAYSSGLTLTYTKPSSGGLMSPAVQTDSFIESFVPTGLNPPAIDPPACVSASNDTSGMEITIIFDEDIVNTDFSEMATNFSISVPEYNYVPLGNVQNTTRTVSSVVKLSTRSLKLIMNTPNFSSAVGDIIVNYDGLGGLRGYGGPTSAFSKSFTPSNLTWKGNQNDAEHIKLNSISTTITLKPLLVWNAQVNKEHISFVSISATATLTDIHEL